MACLSLVYNNNRKLLQESQNIHRMNSISRETSGTISGMIDDFHRAIENLSINDPNFSNSQNVQLQQQQQQQQQQSNQALLQQARSKDSIASLPAMSKLSSAGQVYP